MTATVGLTPIALWHKTLLMTDSFRRRLRANEKLLGLILTLPSPEVAEIAASAGFDWLFLDMEHGLFDVAGVQHAVQAVAGRCACVARLPSHDGVWIKKVLDIGLDGIILPQVNSGEEATNIVRLAKYPPMGQRSTGIGRAHGYGTTFAEYVATANDTTAIIAQIEHIDAVRNIDYILNVPGIDAAFVGPFDLSASLNLTGQIGSTEVQAAITRVRNACRARQFPLGIFAPTLERSQTALADGFTLLAAGADISLLTESMRQLVTYLKQ